MRPVQHFGGRGATSPIGRRRPPYALQCSLEHRWYWSRGQSMAAQPCKVPACGVWGAGTVQATGVAPCARALASDHASAACIIPAVSVSAFAGMPLPRMPLLPACSAANLVPCAPISCAGIARHVERGKDKLTAAHVRAGLRRANWNSPARARSVPAASV